MFRRPPRPSRPRRGAAMIEFVLCLPFFVFVLVLLLYYARGMVRVQHAQVMDRYEAWRQQAGAPGPAPSIPHNHIQLNQAFYAGRAVRLDPDSNGSFPSDAGDELVSRSQSRSDQASRLAEEALDRFPRGNTVRVTTTHNDPIPLWDRNRYTTNTDPRTVPISHQHTRLGNDWRHANGIHHDPGNPVPYHTADGAAMTDTWEPLGGGPWMLDPVREVFLKDMDTQLEGMSDADNHLASFIRSVYTHRPGYVGPTAGFP